MDVAAALGGPAAAVGVGYLLKRTQLFTQADGETAAKYAVWVTLPSLILQCFNRLSPADLPLPVVSAALVLTGASAGVSWLAYRGRYTKERALLAGSTLGAALPLAAYPLVEALFGAAGLRTALLAGVANTLAVWVGSYLLFATAGAAFPEQYTHLDGGMYRGEWKGMLKEGYGVYTYPSSGARYEGEWRNGLKEGRGIYHFPKGGVYEGEWRGGKIAGVGVRTFSSGRVQAGVWREGKLESAMEEWQCALAVEGANEAAAVARSVQVGGGGAGDALQQLAADPATWAYAAAAALVVLGRPLTPTLDLLTAQLARAHAPLALVALGLTLDLAPPQQRQAGEVAGVMALRLLPPLLASLAACALLTKLGWGATAVLALVGPLAVCGVTPAAPQVLAYAYRFRLNENLAAAVTRASTAAGLLLMPLTAAAAAASARAATLLPFAAVLAAASVAVGGAAALARLRAPATQQWRQRQKIKMVYAAPEGPAAVAAAAAALEAVQLPAASRAAGSQAATAAAAAEAAAAPSPLPSQEQQQVEAGEPNDAAPSGGAAELPSGSSSSSTSDGGGSGTPPSATEHGSSPGAAAPSPTAEQPPQRQRRRSAFSDLDDSSAAQPPGALGSLPAAPPQLRWRQPCRFLLPARRQRPLGRRIAAAPAFRSPLHSLPI